MRELDEEEIGSVAGGATFEEFVEQAGAFVAWGALALIYSPFLLIAGVAAAFSIFTPKK